MLTAKNSLNGFGSRRSQIKKQALLLSACFLASTIGIAQAQTVLTTDSTVTGIVNGHGAGGYVVEGGTLTVNNATLKNFTTTGGAGSGGGGGLGGAIFVNGGAAATLNNVNFYGNTAIGGASVSGAISGGTLNGVSTSGVPVGASGVNGVQFNDNNFQWGDGMGDGMAPSILATPGADSATGIGGHGGSAANGSNGWSSAPPLIAAVASASTAEALALKDFIAATKAPAIDTNALGVWTDLAAGLAAGAAGCDLDFCGPGLADAAVAAGEMAAALGTQDGIDVAGLVVATANLAAATNDLTWASGALANWNSQNNAGHLGFGGAGGTGGNGGASGFGFGGGVGGNGGNGGNGGGNAANGAGGSGGSGGVGGFGAGGGAGGVAGTSPTAFLDGSDGPGGSAGFGGGVGATGGSSGGGGGSGYGGSIFVASGGTLTITGNATFNRGNVVGGLSQTGGIAGDAVGTDIFMQAGSTVILDPGVGNVQTFNGTIADDSIASIANSSLQYGQGANININSGLVIFNGANTYSGTTILNGGVLQAQDGTGLYANSNLDFNGGTFLTTGTFDRFVGPDSNRVQWTGSGGFAAGTGGLTVSLNGNDTLVWDQNSFVPNGSSLIFGSNLATGSVTWTNNIDLNGGNRTILVQANSDNSDGATITGVISDGSLTIGGAGYSGILTLTGVNTYAGTTTLNSGATLILSGGGSIANSSSVIDNGTLDISSGGASMVSLAGNGSMVLGAQTLTLTNASDTFGGVISGTGRLTVSGGTETLTGTNTYTGLTVIGAGDPPTLALSGTGSIATSSGVVDNGIFDISATTSGASITTLSGNGAVVLGAQTLTLTNANDTFAGVIGGAGGLTLTGGTEMLTGANTYTGLTAINNGTTLALSSGGSIATSSGVADNGIFDISATTAGASIITLSGNGSIILGAQTLTLTNASDTFGGVIGGTGGLTVSGGTETLTGTNTYTGLTVIGAGDPPTLALSGTGSIATSSGVVDNGIFDISATTSGASITTLSGNGAVVLGAQTLTLTNANDTFAGVIGGAGGLTLTGGTEMLTGANTYTGLTAINNGTTLALSSGGSIATSSGVADNGIFDISATTAGASIITLSGNGSVVLGAQTLTLTNAGDTFSGVIGGTGGFAVSGGSEVLTGINTYTGGTAISGGASLFLTGSGNIATSSGVADDGVFNISGTISGASIATLSGDGIVTLGAKTLTISNGNTSFGGVIDGSGGLMVAGGTQALSGINTYTGGTAINGGGTLALSGAGSIATSSGVTDNGAFDISATTSGASIVTLSGSGTVALGNKTLTLTNASSTFSGAIGGAGSLAITGGTESLTGISTYSGGTSVTNATVAVDSDAALGAPSGSLALTNGRLTALSNMSSARAISLSGTGTINTNLNTMTLSGVIGGSGALTAAGGGTLTLSGVNTYSGGTSIIQHTTLIVGSDAALGAASAPAIVQDGLLLASGAFSSTRPFTVDANGKIDSNGYALNLTGPITLDLGTGPVTVFTGTTQANGAWTLTAQNGLVVYGTLNGSGTISDNTTVNGTLAPGNSPGTITFLGSVVMTSGSITAIDIDGTGTGAGAGNYDRIIVQGAGHTFTAAGTLQPRLRGITGSANNNYTPPVGQQFNIIHTDAGVLGSFASLTEPGSGLAAGTRLDAVYSNTDVNIVVTPASYANLTPLGVTDTANRMSLGASIDSYRLAPGVRMTGDRNPVLTALYGLPAGSIGASMDQIAGAVHGDALNAALSLNRLFSSATEDHRQRTSLSLASVGRMTNGQYAAINGVASPEPAQLTDASPVWALGFGQFSTTKTDGNAPGYRDNAGGVIAGIDLARHAGVSYGVALGAATSHVLTKNAATANVTSERAIAYGGIVQDEWRFNGELATALEQYSSNRLIQIGSLSRNAHGSSTGWGFSASGSAHYGTGWASPFVELRDDYVSRSAFTETNAGDLSLNVHDESLNTPRSELGLDVRTTDSGDTLGMNLRLAWAHDFGTPYANTQASLVGSPLVPFKALSSKIGAEAALGNLAVTAKIDDTMSIYGEYDVEARTRSTSQQVSFGVHATW